MYHLHIVSIEGHNRTSYCDQYSRFIEKFGTHIIVGIKMGGKDVVYMKQQHSSSLEPADVQKRLKAIADKRFCDASEQYGTDSELGYQNDKV